MFCNQQVAGSSPIASLNIFKWLYLLMPYQLNSTEPILNRHSFFEIHTTLGNLSMRIHYIQHGVFDELGAIEIWAKKHGHHLTCTKIFQLEALPEITAFDFLVILGGTQSLREEKHPEYIYHELDFIKRAIDNDKMILGICLGAQMIAESLGAKTQMSPYPEIGIFPVMLASAGKDDPVLKSLSPVCNVMHMHYDMPGQLEGARILASSQGCPLQAFALGSKIYGIQFHLEMTNENIRLRLAHLTEEFEIGPYVATRDKLRAVDMEPINKKMFDLLDVISTKI